MQSPYLIGYEASQHLNSLLARSQIPTANGFSSQVAV